MKVEFLATSDGHGLIVKTNGRYQELTSGDVLIKELYNLIADKTPEALKSLIKLYGKDKYAIVLRFCKCNWNVFDSTPDIDDEKFNLEFVPCPLRGECEYENIICNPRLDCGVTPREIQIIILICDGLQDKEIAKRLFISVKTAENHRNHILSKLDLHSKAQIVRWAHDHNIVTP